jgi:hypothetical protein
VPLHTDLAAELRELVRESPLDRCRIFTVGGKMYWTFKADLLRASIEAFIASGRKADFHSRRYTFATRLAQKGVSQRLAQELIRHSDANLTAKLYTDASQWPTFAAVALLEREGFRPPAHDTHVDPQSAVPAGQNGAGSDQSECLREAPEVAGNEGDWPVPSYAGWNRQMRRVVEPRGFEPLTFSLRTRRSTN